MAQITTDMRETRESAKRMRFEPTAPFTATNVQDAILQAHTLPAQVVSKAINFAMSPYAVLATDTLLLVDTSGGAVTINMMAAAARAGVELTIKDDTGNAVANPISVVPSGAETVDGLAPYPIDGAFSAVKFIPQAGGYAVAP